MSFREAAVERFGEPWVLALEASAGCHASPSGTPVPQAGDERLIFGMLEAVDFQCPLFAWACAGRVGMAGVTMDNLMGFLREQREAVLASRVPPPSWLRVLSGTFNFLREEEP